jgi:hypothetical protein
MNSGADKENYDKLPDFNEWVDLQYYDAKGELEVLGFRPRPSYILHQLSFNTYEVALADYRAEKEEDLKEVVTSEFPAPIAHYFYRFLHGSENELQRLHFLRDTWEAIINFLHALAVGEIRFLNLPLTEPLKFSEFLSNQLNDRLVNIERILDHARTHNVTLECEKVLSKALLTKIRELNQTRNAFSHIGAQSEEQARQFISESYVDAIDVLEQLRSLRDIKVMRYLSQQGLKSVRHERFDGHAMTKTIKDLQLTKTQVTDSGRYLQDDQLIVTCGKRFFGLRPFFYFYHDPNGHLTKLCFFKQTRGNVPDRKLIFEVVGESREVGFDRTIFKPELDELRTMFGLAPD